MSYIDELDALISGNTAPKAETPPKEVYKLLLRRIVETNIQVFHDQYGDISEVVVRGQKGNLFCPVITMQRRPIVTVRSIRLYSFMDRTCTRLGNVFIERRKMYEDLKIRLAKAVPTAGLRPYDNQIAETLGRHLAGELMQQHRCAIFPLIELARSADVSLDRVKAALAQEG